MSIHEAPGHVLQGGPSTRQDADVILKRDEGGYRVLKNRFGTWGETFTAEKLFGDLATLTKKLKRPVAVWVE
jgi:hypothetical protein